MTDTLCDPRIDALLKKRGVRSAQDAFDLLRDLEGREIPDDLRAALAGIGLEVLLVRLGERKDVRVDQPPPDQVLGQFRLGIPFDRRVKGDADS